MYKFSTMGFPGNENRCKKKFLSHSLSYIENIHLYIVSGYCCTVLMTYLGSSTIFYKHESMKAQIDIKL